MEIQHPSDFIENQKKLLYRVWCRIFFSEAASPMIMTEEKNKKFPDFHVAILDFIIMNHRITAEDLKKQYKDWESYVLEMRDGLLLIEQNKEFKLNPMFLENVPKIIQKVRYAIALGKQSNDVSNERKWLICKNCNFKNDELLVKIRPKQNCESCGSINLFKPERDVQELERCDNLLKKIDRFQKLKKQIQQSLQNLKNEKKKKEQQIESSNRSKTKLELLFQKLVNKKSTININEEEQLRLQNSIKQKTKYQNFSEAYFKSNNLWPRKLKKILKNRDN